MSPGSKDIGNYQYAAAILDLCKLSNFRNKIETADQDFHLYKESIYTIEWFSALVLSGAAETHFLHDSLVWPLYYMLLRETQAQVDIMYNKILDVIINEMNVNIPYKDININKRTKKRFKCNKPYWNDELSNLWSNMHEHEKAFLKYKGNNKATKSELRQAFMISRKVFDKKLRYFDRRYHRGLDLEIEDFCTKDPKEFWRHVQNLGPRKSSSVPIEIVDENGNVSNNVNEVLNKWKDDFETLYTGKSQQDEHFDDVFLDTANQQRIHLEQQMLEPLFIQNKSLNKNFTIEEIKKCVNKAKNNKAVGIDRIPYEILRYDNIIELLREFYQFCFDTNLVPNLWRRALIHPIPKDKKKDQRIPLNYRGISLLNTIMKIYSSMINSRITEFEDSIDLIVDEQNGFRTKRSCTEHIYILNSIINSSLKNNMDVFCAFIDF